jgi:hypothetical protein
VDSIKASYSNVLLVDAGGFFPEDDIHRDVSWFLMDAMKVLNTDAVGLGEKELRFGEAYLKAQVKRTQLPIVCANLYDKKTGKTVVAPYLIKKVGDVKVGVFGLMSNQVELGIAKDSLRVEEPGAAAKRTVAELRKKGATIVVLLSQLGKVESEDLVTAQDGIDAVVVGHNTPLLQKGRMIKSTVAVYGGEQGQYMGRTIVSLNKQGRMTTGDAETFILGPEVGEKKDIATLVKGFEDAFNERLAKAEKENAASSVAKQNNSNPDHFLGAELCMRCHVQEATQWKSTPHSHAWQTLVDVKKDATPECVACHVVGYKQSGGFIDGAATPTLVNVQCESCHGMGTQHEAFASVPRRITEQTCTPCHTASNSPTFNFTTYMPHIAHHWTGELPKLPENPAKKAMQQGMMKSDAGSH